MLLWTGYDFEQAGLALEETRHFHTHHYLSLNQLLKLHILFAHLRLNRPTLLTLHHLLFTLYGLSHLLPFAFNNIPFFASVFPLLDLLMTGAADFLFESAVNS